MKGPLLLAGLCLVGALKIKEIKNPILPVRIGQGNIILSKHTFLYHINLTTPELSLIQIKTSLIKLNNSLDFKNNNHYSILLKSKISNVLYLTETALEKANRFYEQPRTKRGLINGVGKAQKWLFGTLDSDDEKHLESYLNILNENEIKLNNDLKNQQSVLKQFSNTYVRTFRTLNENQIKISNHIKYLSTEINNIIDLSQAFSFSSMIDNLLIALHSIQNIFSNIETAISFAKLNTLHNSIVQPNQLEIMLTKLNKIYGKNKVPTFKNIMSYYYLFSTQFIIKDNIVLFKIHAPLVSSKYEYFHIFPVPILNRTIIPDYPFLLLNTEDYWTTSQRCPEVEDWYFCLQKYLHKHQPCLATIIQTGKNECVPTQVHFDETSISQINANELLIIPSRITTIKSSCPTEGIYEVWKPSTISLDQCTITINEKIFRAEQTTHEEIAFDLPEIGVMNKSDHKEEMFHIKQIDGESINQIGSIVNNMRTTDLSTPPSSSHPWINTTLFVVILICGACFFLYVKRSSKIIQPIGIQQKIIEPLFSPLGRKESCSQTT